MSSWKCQYYSACGDFWNCLHCPESRKGRRREAEAMIARGKAILKKIDNEEREERKRRGESCVKTM